MKNKSKIEQSVRQSHNRMRPSQPQDNNWVRIVNNLPIVESSNNECINPLSQSSRNLGQGRVPNQVATDLRLTSSY